MSAYESFNNRGRNHAGKRHPLRLQLNASHGSKRVRAIPRPSSATMHRSAMRRALLAAAVCIVGLRDAHSFSWTPARSKGAAPARRTGPRGRSSTLRMAMGSNGPDEALAEARARAEGEAAAVSGLETDAEAASQFKEGSELFQLRRRVQALRQKVKHYERTNDQEKLSQVEAVLEDTRLKDPLAVYSDTRAQMWQAAKAGDFSKAAALRDEASGVQEFLPQYNLEGLWVGNYGTHGYEIIEIAYENVRGEQWLVATEVTGDEHVAAGECTFRVNLTPDMKQPDPLAVTVRGEEVELEAFVGEGVIAEKGGKSRQSVPGKLILFEANRFAFVWTALAVHITFGRVDPSSLSHI